MSYDKSRPMYPVDSHNYFEDYNGNVPVDNSVWENGDDSICQTIEEAQLEEAKIKRSQLYNTELSNEIAFDDLNEDIKGESQVDFDVVMNDVDISSYEDDYESYSNSKRLY